MPMAIKLDYVWFWVLLLLEDNMSRGSYRLLSKYHQGLGEAMRHKISLHCRLQGHMTVPEIIRRIRFWTPWYRVRFMFQPPLQRSQAYTWAVTRWRLLKAYRRTAVGFVEGREVIEVYGYAMHSHRHHEFVEFDGELQWIPNHKVIDL